MTFEKKNFSWNVVEILGEIQKNKADKIRINKVESNGTEYGQIQIWHTNQDNVSIPVKDKNITFRSELKDQLIEALQKL